MIAFNYKYKDLPTFIFHTYLIVLILILQQPISSTYVAYENEYEYKSLCHMEKINVTVSKDDDYKYFPKSYINVECRSPDTYVTKYTQMCDFAGFQCIKKTRTLPIFRRSYALWQHEPWKLFKEEIQGYGCECKHPQKLYYN